MKILYVIPYFSPKYGGTVQSIALLSQEMARRGHEVTIATSDLEYDPAFARDVKQKSVTVIPFPVVAHLGLFIYTPSMRGWLMKKIGEYDIVHLHEFRSYQNALASRAAVANGIPVVLQAHGSVIPRFDKKRLQQLFDIVWGNRILNRVSAVIALCETEANQYREMGIPGVKIEVIPNGLDLSQFSDLPKKDTFRSKYKIPAEEKIVLFLGRLHKIKGIDVLIDAYAELVREHSAVTFVIAGPDDNYASELHQQIQRRNFGEKEPLFTGPLYGQDKLAAYVDADVYVLPSRYETFPFTVLEAWACGTPVIVSSGCLISDIIGRAGYISECNPTDLKKAIVKIINDDDERDRIGEIGRAIVHSELRYSSVIESVESLYNHLAHEPKE